LSLKPALAIFLILSCLQGSFCSAQKIVVCANYELYSMDVSSGNCKLKKITTGCFANQAIFSVAMLKDTLYFFTTSGGLFRQVINDPSSCKMVLNYVGGNALTISKEGIIYYVTDFFLFSINPADGREVQIGRIPYQSAGDLIFYKGKLLMASTAGIVEVDIQQPVKSKLLMSTESYNFFGLVSVPDGCKGNKVYGISANDPYSYLYELDIENKKVLSQKCALDMLVLDAASITESGNTEGVNVNDITVSQFCNAGDKGSIKVNATTASQSGLSYTLNGNAGNTSGIFNDLDKGEYLIRITSSNGCLKDTSVNIRNAALQSVSFETFEDTCNNGKGAIRFSGSTAYPPLSFSLNGNAFSNKVFYDSLAAGSYQLKARNAAGCYIDSNVLVKSHAPPSPVTSINKTPVLCEPGQLEVMVKDPSLIKGFIVNNGVLQQSNIFDNLKEGTYKITTVTNTCKFDTVVQLSKLLPEPPSINFALTAPGCYNLNDGSVKINIEGSYKPFLISFGGAAFSSTKSYPNLDTGIYSIHIKDGKGCLWDTSAMLEYMLVKPTILSDVKDVVCWTTEKGSVRFNVNGANAPYKFDYLGQSYQAGATLGGLTPGIYKFPVTDKMNCVVDTMEAEIKLSYKMDAVKAITVHASICDRPTGAIKFTMHDNISTAWFSINGGAYTIQNNFEKLDAGNYSFRLKDDNGCAMDSMISIKELLLPSPVTDIIYQPAICDVPGSIMLETNRLADSFRLNNGAYQQEALFNRLPAGLYHISFRSQGCHYDTTVTLQSTRSPEPEMDIIVTPVDCYDRNNASIKMQLSGGAPPFTYNFSNTGYSNINELQNIGAGNYSIQVKDIYGCAWDTTAGISIFQLRKPFVSYRAKRPDCWQDDNGELLVQVNGLESPYRLLFENRSYTTGTSLRLPAGEYHFLISNKNNCIVDSLSVDLSYENAGTLPCDTILIPTAFTPNGDGKNDHLRPSQKNNYGFVDAYELNVFNRFGQVVFTSKDIVKGWDGRYNGQLQPAGTYIWTISYQRNGKRKLLKGYSVLMR